jgi:hypothetical protein
MKVYCPTGKETFDDDLEVMGQCLAKTPQVSMNDVSVLGCPDHPKPAVGVSQLPAQFQRSVLGEFINHEVRVPALELVHRDPEAGGEGKEIGLLVRHRNHRRSVIR